MVYHKYLKFGKFWKNSHGCAPLIEHTVRSGCAKYSKMRPENAKNSPRHSAFSTWKYKKILKKFPGVRTTNRIWYAKWQCKTTKNKPTNSKILLRSFFSHSEQIPKNLKKLWVIDTIWVVSSTNFPSVWIRTQLNFHILLFLIYSCFLLYQYHTSPVEKQIIVSCSLLLQDTSKSQSL